MYYNESHYIDYNYSWGRNMSNINVFDYIKFNVLQMRTPELIQKMKIKELFNKINSNRYKFVNQKTNALTPDCAQFIYEMYKTLYPILGFLKEEYNSKDQSGIIKYIAEYYFTEEQRYFLESLEKENIKNEISVNGNISRVFGEIKTNFKKLQKSITPEQIKLINSTYNSLKNFSELSAFDFYMFLKFFNASLPEGEFSKTVVFKSSTSIQAVDDLIKLDSSVASVMITTELVDAVRIFQEFRGIPPIPDKTIKALLVKIKNLHKTELLSDVIKYLLKDILYKTIATTVNINVYILYIANLTDNLKSNMESIVRNIKDDKISGARNKVFHGIPMVTFSGLNDEYNGSLEKYELPLIASIEPLQYLQTFIIEIYEKSLQKEINELCVTAEFVDKDKQKANMDAYYYFNVVREKILKLDEMYSSNASDGKRLKLLLSSKSKAMSNLAMIESSVNKINEQCNAIIIDAFSAIVDMSTVLKNTIDDVKNNSKKTIKNGAKLVHDDKINFDIIEQLLPSMDNFIMLMKYFIR